MSSASCHCAEQRAAMNAALVPAIRRERHLRVRGSSWFRYKSPRRGAVTSAAATVTE